MVGMKHVAVIAQLLVACGGSSTNPIFGAGTGGAAGSAGVAGEAGVGAAGVAGQAGCPEHMLDRGTYCIDDRPALYVSGQQGIAVAWQNANDNCTIRGLRLCTEDERESSCGETSYDSFCSGPANTWEWSATGCADGRRLSPCCGVVQGYGSCDLDETKLESFHCCLNLF